MTLLTTRNGYSVTLRQIDLSVIEQWTVEPIEPKGWKEGSAFRPRDEALSAFHRLIESTKGQKQ